MKVAVSLPDPIFEAAERLASERGIARSQLVAEALAAYLAEHGAEAITARLDRVLSDEVSVLPDDLVLAQSAVLSDEAW